MVLSPEHILNLYSDERPGGPANVRAYIRHLRKKLEEEPARPRLIETVREFGYRYHPPEKDTSNSEANDSVGRGHDELLARELPA